MNYITKYNTSHPSVSSLVRSFLSDEFLNWPKRSPEARNSVIPAVNIVQDKEKYTIDLAAPGMKKEDFKIQLDGDTLTISAEMPSQKEDASEKYLRREFGFTNFRRSFILPENAIAESDIKATYENGVLSLELPKKEEVKPQPVKKIEIL